MNVFMPQRCRLPGGLRCVYDTIYRLENGEIASDGCGVCSKDVYNIYPEHDSTGRVINQDINFLMPNDLKLGPTVIWENITNMHQDGMSFDLRPFPADIHPLYHKEYRNIPVLPKEGEEFIGEVFGGGEPALVSSGWIEESFYGHDRVERCRFGIYGRMDRMSTIVRPKCLKGYDGQLKDWINFTNLSEKRHREIFIDSTSDEGIKDLCRRTFDEVVAKRVADAIIYIKKGGYINLWELMKNNFIPEDQRRNFTNRLSLKTKAHLYRGTINLEYYFKLYDYIDKMEWKHKYVDMNGRNRVKVTSLLKEIRMLYKQNLLNYILNYPTLQNVQVGLDEGYKTNERYWYAMMIFKRARKQVVNKKLPLPQWLVSQYRDTGKHQPTVVLFNEKKLYNKCCQQEKDDYLESKIVRVPNANDLYPKMKKIEDVIDYHEKTLPWYTFCDILKAGRRWNESEIQTAWDIFSKAWNKEDPSIFWEWIDELASRPLEDEIAMNGKDIIQEGACRLDFGEGNVTETRSFALNLINLRVGCRDDSFEVNKMPLQNWYEVSGRSKPGLKANPKEIFWNKLALCGGLIDDRWHEEHGMSENDYKEATNNISDVDAYEYKSLQGPMGFSDSDFNSTCIYDPETGECIPLREEEPWQDEE